MPNIANKSETLEILISTMHRDSLQFLEAMFPHGDYCKYAILIVNQTTEDVHLKSNLPNIRVINSLEKGLPQSRNLALKNAVGDICLIADEDVKYEGDFHKIILDAFHNSREADLITFKMVDETGKDFKQYQDIVWHNKKTINTVNSVVIGIRRKVVLNKHVFFDPLFGLGSTFETGDEYVFLRNTLDEGLKIKFEPRVILSHPFRSSGREAGSDRLVFSRAALFYKYSGQLGYLRVFKYVYLIFKRGYIKVNQIIPKLATGFKSIAVYKKLTKNKTKHV